jgi:hydroxyacylglutathione hydrolase
VQLTERLYLVGSGEHGFGLTHRSDCHVYLVDGGSEMALIDSGSGVDDALLMRRLERLDVDTDRIEHLFITHAHADHAGGAAGISEALDVSVTCSAEVATILRAGDEKGASVDVGKAQGTYAPGYEYRATRVDREVVDGQRITVGDVVVEVIATPGHATGHTCYLVHDGEHSDLFTGDTLLFGGQIILQDTWDCDLRTHIESLRHLAKFQFDGFYPGHLTFSVRDGERHLQAAIAALDRGAIPPTLL